MSIEGFYRILFIPQQSLEPWATIARKGSAQGKKPCKGASRKSALGLARPLCAALQKPTFVYKGGSNPSLWEGLGVKKLKAQFYSKNDDHLFVFFSP